MKKNVKMGLYGLISMVLCIALLTGCIGKMTPKKLMISVVKNMTDIDSFTNSLTMDIKMENLIKVTEVSMDIEMENTLNPQAGHAKGTASINMQGIKLNGDLEVYQVTEGDKKETYSAINGLWSKSESDTGSGISVDRDILKEIGDEIDKFHLADEPVRVGEKDCYELYGEVTGDSLIGILGTDMIHAYGLVNLPDENAIRKLKIPITIDVYQEDKLPARLQVDMTDVLDKLYDSYQETTDVNDFRIDLTFNEYNHVNEIQVPEEVKNQT